MQSFLNVQSTYDDAKYVILPVPMEFTVSYGKGTSKGPACILEASVQLESYDEELGDEPIKLGIHTMDTLTECVNEPHRYIEIISGYVNKIINDDKIPLVFGGEHSLSYGVFKGLISRYNDITIVHFDAHLDLRDTYEGSKYSHACVIRRMYEHKANFKNIVSIGIRSVSPEEALYLKESGHTVFYAQDLFLKDMEDQIDKLISEKIFITFDVDALNPSIVPSTGTPEPGGLEWYQLLKYLRKILSNRKLIAADFVELAPDGINIHSEFTVAKLVYKILAYHQKYGQV